MKEKIMRLCFILLFIACIAWLQIFLARLFSN